MYVPYHSCTHICRKIRSQEKAKEKNGEMFTNRWSDGNSVCA